MRHLPNTTTSPPGQWRYRMPETGQSFGPLPDLETLLAQVRASYKANGYDIPNDLPARIEAHICDDIPEYCTGNDPVLGTYNASLLGQAAHTFHSAVACLKALSGHVRSGERVEIQTAEVRASICLACPRKVEVSGCSSCNKATLVEAVKKIAGARTTSLDGALRYCGVCDCSQSAIIWINRDAKLKSMSDAQQKLLPATCWLVTEGEYYG
jgi:hypothetical protein